jgi:hypothetical protein
MSLVEPAKQCASIPVSADNKMTGYRPTRDYLKAERQKIIENRLRHHLKIAGA